MRARELLTEYERERARQALGDAFWKSALRDRHRIYGVDINDLEGYAGRMSGPLSEIIKGVFASPSLQKEVADAALARIEDADPSTNKKYTQWMARMFANGSERALEDVTSTLADAVSKFHKLSVKKKLMPSDNDINRYKTANQLYLVMDRYEDPIDDGNEGKADKVYEDADVTVIIPRDEPAACRYGRKTRWCTAALHGSNYFEHYNRQGPLYILIPKHPSHDGEKYQLHFATAQYMDENDDPIDIAMLLKDRFPGAGHMFLNDESTAKHLVETVAFASDDVLKGVVQEIWELARDRVSDVITDWEANDDYYYKWLREEGYADEEGDINWDKAPSYTEFNDEARRWMDDIEEFVNLSPKYLRQSVRDQISDGTFDEDSVYQIDSYLAENLRREMRKENDGGIADWIDRNIMIRRGHNGYPVVELSKRRARP